MSTLSYATKMREYLSLLESSLPLLALNISLCHPPVLARHPPATRSATVSELRHAANALEPIISAIEGIQSSLDSLRCEVLHQKASYANAHTPVHALPAEVLVQIFRMLTDEDTHTEDSDTTPAVTLSHVCRTWREVCFASRALWTIISLPMHQKILELYTEKSQTLALNVKCRDDYRYGCGCSKCWRETFRGTQLEFSIPPAIAPRVRTIALDITIRSEEQLEFEEKLGDMFFHQTSMRLLERVDIRLRPDDVCPETRVHQIYLNAGRFPGLNEVNLQGVSVQFGPNALAVKHMSIALPLSDDFAQMACKQLLNFDNLTSLSLRSSRYHELDDFSPQAPEPVEQLALLPSLRKLSLSLMDRMTASSLLSSLTTPQLETLELFDLDPHIEGGYERPHTIHEAMRRACGSISTLVLKGMYPSLDLLRDLALPPGPPASVPLPQLQRVVCVTPPVKEDVDGLVAWTTVRAAFSLRELYEKLGHPAPELVDQNGVPLALSKEMEKFES